MSVASLIGSALDEPLDVVSIVLAIAGLHAGVAAAIALMRGASADDIAAAATKGGAAGFILGVAVGAVATVYFVLD